MDLIFKLMQRELRYTWAVMKAQLFICLVFTIVFPLFSPPFSLFVIIVMPYMMTYGLSAFEEKSHTHTLVATLPVSSDQICLSKYLLNVFYLLIAIMGTFIMLFLGAITLPPDEIRIALLAQPLQSISIILTIGLIYIAFIIPFLLKFGAEKGRFLMMAIYILGFALSGSIPSMIGTNMLNRLLSSMTPLFCLLIALIVFYLSYLISRGICIKREY